MGDPAADAGLEPPRSREMRVYTTAGGNTIPTLDETFYTLSSSELGSLASGASQAAQTLREGAPLLTAKLRDEKDAARAQTKRERYPVTAVRVKTTDGVLIQGRFGSGEKVGEIYGFVAEALAPNAGFVLYTAPPLADVAPHRGKTFLQAGFTPAVLLHVKLQDGGKAQWSEATLAQIQSLPQVADGNAGSAGSANGSSKGGNSGSTGGGSSSGPNGGGGKPKSGNPTMPKWMKIKK